MAKKRSKFWKNSSRTWCCSMSTCPASTASRSAGARKRWDMTGVPLIMVTGMDDLESINEAYEAGANDFISKPINWPILGHRARYVLRSAQAARQLRELEEKQAAIVRAMPDMIFLIDWQGTYLDYKAGYGSAPYRAIRASSSIDMFGGPAADCRGLVQQASMRLAERQAAVRDLQAAAAGGIHYHEARVAPSGVDKVVVVVRDITAAEAQRGEDPAPGLLRHADRHAESPELSRTPRQ
jgi:CheY-like chemotaxis protein